MTRSVSARLYVLLTAALFVGVSPSAIAADASPPPAAKAPSPTTSPSALPHARKWVWRRRIFPADMRKSIQIRPAPSAFSIMPATCPNNNRLIEDSYFLAAQVGDFAQAVPAAK
jgi:hypothetical protein